jgi:hypothetical protein
MHLRCPFVDLSFGIDVEVQAAATGPPVNQLDTADLDDAMAVFDL